MRFEDGYERFIEFHKKHLNTDGRGRLHDGHGHAEKLFIQNVWWPAFQHFDNLHPEYEVYDFKDGSRYLDFAYIQSHFRIALEIDGFGPHWRNITKWQFSDHCQPQNDLIIDGWHVLRFTYDDVNERPRNCQKTIHQMIGKLVGNTHLTLQSFGIIDQEIVRLTMRSPRPVTPTQVSETLRVSPDTAIRHMHQLCRSNWLQPASGLVGSGPMNCILLGVVLSCRAGGVGGRRGVQRGSRRWVRVTFGRVAAWRCGSHPTRGAAGSRITAKCALFDLGATGIEKLPHFAPYCSKTAGFLLRYREFGGFKPQNAVMPRHALPPQHCPATVPGLLPNKKNEESRRTLRLSLM